jgi:hypothetical protein
MLFPASLRGPCLSVGRSSATDGKRNRVRHAVYQARFRPVTWSCSLLSDNVSVSVHDSESEAFTLSGEITEESILGETKNCFAILQRNPDASFFAKYEVRL